MCGRTRLATQAESLRKNCAAAVTSKRYSEPSAKEKNESLSWSDQESYRCRENISPGTQMPVLCRADEADASTARLRIKNMTWGLIPSFEKKNTKPNHYRMFNARVETVNVKPIFSRLLKKRRCAM